MIQDRKADSKLHREVARDISYSSSAASRAGRALIRTVENLTGRPKLIRMARGYDADVALGRDFWQVIAEKYRLKLEVVAGSLDNIPRDRPVVVIANHPYGILDGLVLGNILSTTRGDFRILAHRVFRKAEELDRVILPISFDETKEAVKLNIETRKEALRYLGQGGAIGIFPGGTVATAMKPFGRAMDPRWRSFTARLIAKTDAAVVPIYFDGANSRLFQIASHLHSTLRMSLLISEFRRGIKEPVRIAVGNPLPAEELAARRSDPRAMMDFLRESTYRLSPNPIDDVSYGFEFEEHHR